MYFVSFEQQGYSRSHQFPHIQRRKGHALDDKTNTLLSASQHPLRTVQIPGINNNLAGCLCCLQVEKFQALAGGVCSMNYQGVLTRLLALSSERELKVGPKWNGQFKKKLFLRNIHVGMSCCCRFSYVPGLKMFSAA